MHREAWGRQLRHEMEGYSSSLLNFATVANARNANIA